MSVSPLIQELALALQNHRSADWSKLGIQDLWLDNLFSSVRLNDGAVGLALNYDQEGFRQISPAISHETRVRLLKMCSQQPLLWELLNGPIQSTTLQSLLVALLAALSAPILSSASELGGLGLVSQEGRVSLNALREYGSKVTVIGGGGYIEEAMQLDWIERLACCDFNFAKPELNHRYDGLYQRFRSSKTEVLIDSGENSLSLLESSDIICLTASTLCNGTLDDLLTVVPKGAAVVLEGPSGGVLPTPLFNRGVTHLVHNPVDIDYVELSRRFSRQRARGLQAISSGEFIDILLPEQRTVFQPKVFTTAQ